MPQCVQEASTQGLQHLDARFTESIQVKAFSFSLNDFCVWEIPFDKISFRECGGPLVRDGKAADSIFSHQGRDCFKETLRAEVSHCSNCHESGIDTDTDSKPDWGCSLGSNCCSSLNHLNRANDIPCSDIKEVLFAVGGVHEVCPPVAVEG